MKFCLNCQKSVETKSVYHGNIWLELSIWIIALLASVFAQFYVIIFFAAAYSIYRQLTVKKVCAICAQSHLVNEDNPSALKADNTKNCPFCAEPIQQEAIKCKHCGADLPVVSNVS